MTERKATGTIENRSSEDKTPERVAAGQQVTGEERYRMIAETAYYRALARGFAGGDVIEDWLAAEREIDGLLLRAPADTDAPAQKASPEAVLGERAKQTVGKTRQRER